MRFSIVRLLSKPSFPIRYVRHLDRRILLYSYPLTQISRNVSLSACALKNYKLPKSVFLTNKKHLDRTSPPDAADDGDDDEAKYIVPGHHSDKTDARQTDEGYSGGIVECRTDSSEEVSLISKKKSRQVLFLFYQSYPSII